jgi:hypothetical protein
LETKVVLKKVEFFEMLKKLVIEILIEVISGVISKLVSGGAPGHTLKRPDRVHATARG